MLEEHFPRVQSRAPGDKQLVTLVISDTEVTLQWSHLLTDLPQLVTTDLLLLPELITGN